MCFGDTSCSNLVTTPGAPCIDKSPNITYDVHVGNQCTIGNDGVVPVLKALIHRPDSVKMRMGAHHVLHDLSTDESQELLQPLLTALDNLESPEVPLLAMQVLNKLQ